MIGTEPSSVTIVWLRGEHDLATVAALSEVMDRAMALDGVDLVVDLRDVDFMGVATVDILLRTRELLRQRSRSMVLRAPSAAAQRILGLCGLAELFDSRPVAPPSVTGPGGVLGTWMAVPATVPVDRAYLPLAEPATIMVERGGP